MLPLLTAVQIAMFVQFPFTRLVVNIFFTGKRHLAQFIAASWYFTTPEAEKTDFIADLFLLL